MEKIPLILVLGFLGSGKTSFIKQLLKSGLAAKNPAIIQNEFAPAPVDAEVLKQEHGNIEILEINGGSVFCVCRIDNFIPALTEFINAKKPGILVLEASGISDPLSLAEILAAPSLQDKIYYSGAVCIVDCRHFPLLQKINTRVKDQVRIADLVLVNKSDLAGKEEIAACESKVRELNPDCKIRTATYGYTGSHDILNNTNNWYITNHKPPSGNSGLKTAVIRSSMKISPGQLDRFLSRMLPKTIRLKGFVNMSDGRTVMVQSTGTETTITVYNSYNGPSQVIAIGEALDAREFSAAFRESGEDDPK